MTLGCSAVTDLSVKLGTVAELHGAVRSRYESQFLGNRVSCLHFLKGKNSNNCMNKIWSQNFDSGSDSETGRV